MTTFLHQHTNLTKVLKQFHNEKVNLIHQFKLGKLTSSNEQQTTLEETNMKHMPYESTLGN
jgi:hypothetical protein